jgi:hypothetical protein
MKRWADENDAQAVVYATDGADKTKHVLSIESKLKYMRAALSHRGIDVARASSTFEVIRDAAFRAKDGLVTIFAGSDRVADYEKLAKSVLGRYQARGELTGVTIEISNAMDRDSDEAYSATEMRNAAKDGDYNTFLEHSAMPTEALTREMFKEIRSSLTLEERLFDEILKRALRESIEDKGAAEKFAAELSEAGASVYFVGGSVRDELLGRDPNDFDMCAENAKVIKSVFADKIQSEHWTPQGLFFVIDYDGVEIEIISLSKGINKRLEESDITINALARDALTGKIVDPTGGQEDIQSKTIRYTPFMLNAFSEGKRGLALLRGIRFVSQLGWKMSEDSRQAVFDFGSQKHSFTKGINRERVKKEFMKTINGAHSTEALKLLEESGNLENLMSEMSELGSLMK